MFHSLQPLYCPIQHFDSQVQLIGLQTSNLIILIMQAKEKCSQCMYIFSMQKLPRKLPSCEHSICEPCIREIIQTRQDIIICGFCTARVKKEDIRIFSLNTSILLSLSETPVTVQSVTNEEENQLLNDLVPPNLSSSSSRENAVDDLCSVHRAPLDIVCISDKIRICPHCALFGNHRQHRFKRLQDFEREVGEKKKAFAQIQNDKHKSFQNDFYRMGEQLKNLLEVKKGELFKLVEDQFKRYQIELRKRKETAFQQIETLLWEYHQNLRKNGPINKFQKTKNKLEEWEKNCLQNLYRLDSTKKIQDKLSYYYDGPLEIVTQGYIFIEQLNNCKRQAIDKVKQQIQNIKVSFDSKAAKWIQNCVKVTRGQFILTNQLKTSIEQDENESNPFLDCTSSAIILNKSNFINHNTSLQVEINSISTSSHKNNLEAFNTPVRKEPQIKSIRSIQKERPRMQTATMTNIKKPLNQTQSPKVMNNLKRPTSEISFYKSPTKLLKPKQKAQNEQQIKQFQAKEPQKIYLQFSKNTLSDFFDLSDCNLSSDKVVEYVHRARRIHKIRGLKLTNNKLTTSGFEKMTDYLQGVSNINASNNLINETVFDIILKHKQRLDSLKVINLSHNPINLDKKISSKIEEVKKLNIVVTL